MSLLYGRLFGQFLVEKGRLTPSRLDQAIEEQGRINRPLGALAIERGLMTPEQVDAVVRLQRGRGGRFGELARELGHITEEELAGLLLEQAGRHLYLGEWLIREGLLGCAELDALLREFHAANERWACALAPAVELPEMPWAPPAIKAFLRLFSQGVCGTARIDSVSPPGAAETSARLGMGEMAVSASAGENGEEIFSLTALLPRRTLLSLIFCMRGRQTLDERQIRLSLQDFGESVAVAACLACETSGVHCRPAGVRVFGVDDASPERTSTTVRLGLTTSIGECALFVTGKANSGG